MELLKGLDRPTDDRCDGKGAIRIAFSP